jgi:hypothetical protein
MKAFSPLHFITGEIPFSPMVKFSIQFLFERKRAPQALLSMAYYSGYLSFQYPKDEVRGDVLVAPNDDMRDVFISAVLDSLPDHYQTKAWELFEQGWSFFAAVSSVYEAYMAAT